MNSYFSNHLRSLIPPSPIQCEDDRDAWRGISRTPNIDHAPRSYSSGFLPTPVQVPGANGLRFQDGSFWVTEWIDPNLPPPQAGGNIWGVKEDEILTEGCEYILIGNQKIHGRKKIMAEPHKEYALPFLCSRATYPALDRVWVWNR